MYSQVVGAVELLTFTLFACVYTKNQDRLSISFDMPQGRARTQLTKPTYQMYQSKGICSMAQGLHTTSVNMVEEFYAVSYR